MADINRGELVKEIASQTGATAASVTETLTAFEHIVEKSLSEGNKVVLPGFLKFERTERAARVGRNPQTGEALNIPASKGVKISAGSRLKAAVAE